MRTGSIERLQRLWAFQLDRKLVQYIEAVGPYWTYDDLLRLCRTSRRPMFANFSAEYERDAFYEMVIRSVLQRSLESEFSSEPFERDDASQPSSPPFNAEYVLYLVLRRGERDAIVGDLIEDYGKISKRFGKRHADLWFFKQVFGSLWPLLRRAILRIGALVWLSRILRRLIS